MTISKQEKFLNLLPDLYEINLNSKNQSDTIFEKFKQFIDFDEGFIYFLNADSLQLKYSYKNHANYKVEDKFYFQEDFKNFLFTKEAVVLDKKSEFIKIVNLDELNKKSYIVAKIFIKSIIFGVVLLAKNEASFYDSADLSMLKTASCILSYTLKDAELSNVFKIQLKALKDGIIEKHAAYKTIKEQNVIGVVDDCGYTSMMGIVEDLLGSISDVELISKILGILNKDSFTDLIGEDKIKELQLLALQRIQEEAAANGGVLSEDSQVVLQAIENIGEVVPLTEADLAKNPFNQEQ